VRGSSLLFLFSPPPVFHPSSVPHPPTSGVSPCGTAERAFVSLISPWRWPSVLRTRAADLGADVIKIESPDQYSAAGGLQVYREDSHFLVVNRNQARASPSTLRTSAARGVLPAVQDADVMVQTTGPAHEGLGRLRDPSSITGLIYAHLRIWRGQPVRQPPASI